MLVVNADAPDAAQFALVEQPDPRPEPDEVIVEVAAAGVNHADLLQVSGAYPPPPGASRVLGLEVSGTVREVGSAVTGLRAGDQVAALLAGGGYATRVAVPAGQVLPVPAGVSLVDAAALPEAACTVWSTLTAARLTPGQWLLVHGGSGGIGTVAIQVAAAMGAHVATTAGSAERAARCAGLGAEVVVDHRTEDFVDAVRAAVPAGMDVVLDVVGAAYLGRNLDVLADDGRLAVIGLQKGARAELDLGRLLARRLTVLGTTLRARPTAQKAAIVAAVREHVWPMVADGRVRPVVHRTLPLAEAAEAHRLLASGEVFGKVLLTP